MFWYFYLPGINSSTKQQIGRESFPFRDADPFASRAVSVETFLKKEPSAVGSEIDCAIFLKQAKFWNIVAQRRNKMRLLGRSASEFFFKLDTKNSLSSPFKHLTPITLPYRLEKGNGLS